MSKHKAREAMALYHGIVTELLEDPLPPGSIAERERFQSLVDEATDRPSDPTIRASLVPPLHSSHLLGIAAWTQDPDRVPAAIDGVVDALGLLPMLVFFPGAAAALGRLATLIDGSLATGPE